MCDFWFCRLWRWMNMDNAYYGSTLHVVYLTCKCIVRINAYLKYLTITLSIRENGSYTLQKSPSGNKIIHTLTILWTCSRVDFNEKNIFYSYAAVFLVIKKKLLKCHKEKNLREKCRNLFIIMGVRQTAFKKHCYLHLDYIVSQPYKNKYTEKKNCLYSWFPQIMNAIFPL